MNDAAVADEPEVIEPDLVEQAEAEAPNDDEVAEEVESEEKGEAGEEVEPSESSPEKKDDSFQARIDELTGKYRSEERARIEAETRYQQAQQRLKEMETVEPVDPDKTLADFDYDEKAYADHLSKVAKQAAQMEVQQRLEQERMTERQAKFTAAEAAFAHEVNDYNMVTRNPDLTITDTMVAALQTAEKGPDVLYYLGKNPDVARSLAQMHPLDAARELGRIEATKLVKPVKSETKAPPPPPKLKGADKPTTVDPKDPSSDNLSDAEWLKRRNKQLASKEQ